MREHCTSGSVRGAPGNRHPYRGGFHLEAVRKLSIIIKPLSSCRLAVMKRRVATRSEPVQHPMDVTDLDHCSTRGDCALIVLTVSPVPTMPSVRALNHPAFLQWREAFRALRPRLHGDVPPRAMHCHPRFEGVIVILLIRKDCLQTRHILWGDLAEQDRCGDPIIEPSAVIRTASNSPSVSTNRCRLRPVIFLPPSYPRSGPPLSVVLTD